MKTVTTATQVKMLIDSLERDGWLLRDVKAKTAEMAEKETNQDIWEDLLELASLKRKGSFAAYARSLQFKLKEASDKRKAERKAEREFTKACNSIFPESDLNNVSESDDLFDATPAKSTTGTLDNYPVSGDAIAEGLRELAGKKKADKKPAKKDVEKETTNAARGLTTNIKSKIAKVALLVALPLLTIAPAHATEADPLDQLGKLLECQSKLIDWSEVMGTEKSAQAEKDYNECMKAYRKMSPKQ